MNPNLLDISVRKKIIDDIKSPDNVARKMDEQRKFDIYRKRQAQYVLERLQDEFDPESVKSMRKVLSINPCKRIVDEQASLYVSEPDRQFTDTSEEETKQIKTIYSNGKVDPTMRLANRYYKLHGQSCLYVVPRDGYICSRALTPKDYDVVPDVDNPEEAFAYVLNVLDTRLHRTSPLSDAATPSDQTYTPTSSVNESIADKNDRKALLERYVFWSDEFHFTCNGHGEIIDAPYVDEAGNKDPKNPIGMKPFVDIAHEKDFSFFVEIGSDVSEFVIDFLTQLSDLANTCRMQNYSQAIVYSVEEPKSLRVGPNKVLWLKMDPNNQAASPKFSFESPNPDIEGTLEFLNVQLKMFLSSVGLNPGTVSGKNEVEKFASGIDHLLANLDKFKASKEDMDLFRAAECELYEIIATWQNVLFDVTDENGLAPEEKMIKLDPETELTTVYVEPHAVQTDSEIEDYCIKALDKDLMTRKEAIKRMYKVDDARADEIIKELDAEKAQRMKDAQDMMGKGLGLDGKPLPNGPIVDPNKPGAPDPNVDPALDPNVDPIVPPKEKLGAK